MNTADDQSGNTADDSPTDAPAEKFRRVARRFTERVAEVPAGAWSMPTAHRLHRSAALTECNGSDSVATGARARRRSGRRRRG